MRFSLDADPGTPICDIGVDLLYPSPVERATAIAESIIINHPFVDGNKQTGFVLMLGILLDAGLTYQPLKTRITNS